MLVVVFSLVGLAGNSFGILFRPITLQLSFVLETYLRGRMSFLGREVAHGPNKFMAWLLPSFPFYFFGNPVVIRPGLVFMLLTAIFTLLIAQHSPRRRSTLNFGGLRGDRQINQIQKTMILPLLAEIGGSIHVGLAAMGVGIGIGLTGLGMTQPLGGILEHSRPFLVHAILAIALTEAIVFYALFLVTEAQDIPRGCVCTGGHF
jgi:F0F1-type ATP synthase membrane subunit c/vacuolar-type H+-ATPase subunit K